MAADACRPATRSARLDRRGRGGWDGVEFRILRKDLALEFLYLLVRFDPELVDQPLTQLRIDRKRLGLPARAIEGEHPLGMESLTEPVGFDQARRGIRNGGMVAECEFGIQARLLGIERTEPLRRSAYGPANSKSRKSANTSPRHKASAARSSVAAAAAPPRGETRAAGCQ